MLSSMPCSSPMNESVAVKHLNEDRWQRSFKNDLVKAVELLVEFQEALTKLHPSCNNLIENMLQRQRY